MARQPKRRYGQKTAKSGRRRKTSNDTVDYSRVGARRSRYGEKPWRASQNDGTGCERLSRGVDGKGVTTRWDIVGWARGGGDTVKNHGAPAKTTVRLSLAENLCRGREMTIFSAATTV